MEISKEQRKRAARMVLDRRAERGQAQMAATDQIRELKKLICRQIKEIELERRRLLKIARTPGFRHRAAPEDARAAWELLLATASHPLRPPRPRPPRKGRPKKRNGPDPFFQGDWKYPTALDSKYGYKIDEQTSDWLDQASQARRENKAVQFDMAEFKQRLAEALHKIGEENPSAAERLLAIKRALANFLLELKRHLDCIGRQPSAADRLARQPRHDVQGLLKHLITEEKITDYDQIVSRMLAVLGLNNKEELFERIVLDFGIDNEKDTQIEVMKRFIFLDLGVGYTHNQKVAIAAGLRKAIWANDAEPQVPEVDRTEEEIEQQLDEALAEAGVVIGQKSKF